MTDEAKIEKVARAIHDASAIKYLDWDTTDEDLRESCRIYARAALAALSDPAPEATGEVGEASIHEDISRLIYNTWAWSPEFVPWVEGGNSNKQNEARSHAYAVLAIAATALQAENEAMREALTQIRTYGGSYTTGEGHAKCREIAFDALASSPPLPRRPGGNINGEDMG